MAKSVEIDGYNKDKGGPGWKRCPSCEGFVKGPLTKVCPACQHEFTFKSRQVAKPISGTASREVELEQLGMILSLKLGGIVNVHKALDKLKTMPEVALAIKCGSVDNAKAMLTALEARVAGM
jgi:hypothetical protein